MKQETKNKISERQKGKHYSPKTEFKKGHVGYKYWLGKKMLPFSKEHKKKLSESHKEEKAYQRKGEKAGYRAKHKWIGRWYGYPTTCEHCQTGNLTGHQIHWANISGKFLRDRTDWLRLCAKCHGLFDKQKRNKIESYD